MDIEELKNKNKKLLQKIPFLSAKEA